MDLATAHARLPHPLHLYRALTESDHYHLGRFPSGSCDEPLRVSIPAGMDRLVSAAFRGVPPGSRVLDVGSGMGGTAQMLASLGHAVVAVDRDPALVDYARSRVDPRAACPPRFVHGAIESLTRDQLGGPFDVVLMLEVQQHFAEPADCCRVASRFLRRGGTLLLLDLAVAAHPTPAGCPFFACGDVSGEAESHGLSVQLDEDLTAEVRPTLGLLAQVVDRRRSQWFATSGDRADALEAELAELELQFAELGAAFDAGDLCYHQTRLQFGSGPAS